MTEPSGPTLVELRKLADELLASWAAPKTTTMQTATLARDVTVFGYSLHAHKLADSYLRLVDADDWQTAFPTLRACYELAVSAQWTYAREHALLASLREGERQRKNLIDSIIASGIIPEGELQKDLEAAEKASKEHEEAKGLPASFYGICSDFGAPFLYMVYRSLSQFTHAGPAIPNLYVMLDADEQIKAFMPEEMSDTRKRMCLYTLCISLIWAGQATDALGDKHPRRRQLSEAAESLGIPEFLKLVE